MDIPNVVGNKQHPPQPPLRREGILRVLLGRPETATGESHPSGHLLRLLKRPATNNTPLVAVSQGGSGTGDICNKDGTKLAPGDTKARNMEEPTIEGQGMLFGFGLNDNNRIPDNYGTASLFDTKATPSKAKEPGETQKEAKTQSETDPDFYKFPPAPPPQGTKPPAASGPWWRDLLSSPVKRLRLGQWGHKTQGSGTPNFLLPPPLQEQRVPETVNVDTSPSSEAEPTRTTPRAKTRRKDLPKRPSARNMPKPTRHNAVRLATAKKNAGDLVKSVEMDFYANSSRAAKSSRRKTVENILNAGKFSLPLTPTSLKFLVGTLKEAGYKSSHIYLAEAKTLQVEKGFEWSLLLERNYKLCMAAAKRGAGPKRKAVEVPENIWAAPSLLQHTPRQGFKTELPALLFACGVHWMMREIELADLKSSNVKFDERKRMVTITWDQSKMDTECRGLSRTLQCICNEGCDLRCPYAVLEVLVNSATLKGTKEGHIAYCKTGQVATKTEIVNDWQKLHGKKVTGHSTRKSGALQYIRKGWAVSQVGYLGRWKSNVILEYAQEALESMAINASNTFGTNSIEPSTNTKALSLSDMLAISKQVDNKVDKELVQRLKDELESLKEDSTGSNRALTNAIKNIEEKMDVSAKYLPPLVKSARHQAAHRNVKTLVFSPSSTWRTSCGWYYYLANYQFMEGHEDLVSCAKCAQSAQRKEVEGAD